MEVFPSRHVAVFGPASRVLVYHAVAVNEQYRKLIPSYMVRHKVRPGITGLAQVNGYRGGDDLEHMKMRIKFDLEYLRNWSLPLDFFIILKTVALVAKDSRAF